MSRSVLSRLAAATVALAALLPGAARAQTQTGPYHIAARHVLGGAGGWDYLALDTARHRLFITRGDRVMVVDPATGNAMGEVAGINGAHGVAFDYAANRGFATSGRDSSVVAFDLGTLKVLRRIPAAADADAILYEPVSHRVLSLNGDAGSASVIDPIEMRHIGDVVLGGKPEFGVADGAGHVYANIEDSSQVVQIDPVAMRVVRRWSLAPCQSPSGLAIDVAHQRLFSGCHNKVVAISDLRAGAVSGTAPIGSGVDANRYDDGYVFSSNGDGTLTVIHEDSPDHYTVVQNLETMRGARTMEVDPATHRVYTVSAQFGAMPAAAPGAPRRRPPMVPGTFTLLTIER